MVSLASLLQGTTYVPDISMAPPPPTNIPPDVANIIAAANSAPTAASNVQQEPNVLEEPPIGVSGKEPIVNKGLFGVKGTLRDVLGILGDALTGRPTYSTIRRQEKFGDILAGKYQDNLEESFAQNPLLAIQRLAEEGYGKEAADLLQQVQANEIANRRAAATEGREERMARQSDVTVEKTIQEILGKTYAAIKDPKVLEQFNEWARKRLDQLPENSILRGMTLPRTIQEAETFGIQPYQQQRLQDFDVGLGIQQQNANANSRRAAVALPRAESRSEIIERIGNKPPEKRTPGEQAAFEAATRGPSGRGRRTGGGGSASGGSPSAPPRKKGDAYRTSDGRIWRSPDGKSWQ